jgi:prevent-host-death family protein
MAMKVSVADAKNKLPELIKAVEDGQTVTIYRHGVPNVDIIRTKKPSRKKAEARDTERQNSDSRCRLVETHVGRRSRRLRRRD